MYLIRAPERNRSGEAFCGSWIFFTKDGYDIHVHVTQSQGDASRIVKELGEGMDLILCSGGDGTLNETICGMLALKDQPPLVQWEEGELEEDFVFGMVTNTRSVGGFKNLVNQTVALNDGAFEVLLIRMPKTPGDLSNIISHLFLKEEPNEYVYRFKTASICFQSAAPVDWVLDGEYGGARTQAQIGCLREKIRILVDRC